MAAGALGSVSNRLRHENGDTHVVICDDVFSDAGSTPAASTISRRKWFGSLDRKSFIQSDLSFVTAIETLAGGGQLSRRLQYPSNFGDLLIVSNVPYGRNRWVCPLSTRSFPAVPAASKVTRRNPAELCVLQQAEGAIPAASSIFCNRAESKMVAQAA